MLADSSTIRDLRTRIAALERGGAWAAGEARPALAFGLAALDGHLPWGGLAAGAVHELIDGDDGGDAASPGKAPGRPGGRAGSPGGAVTAFAAALAARAQRPGADGPARPVVWIAPRTPARESLYAPGLAAFGLDPARLVVVRIPTGGGARQAAASALWAFEEVLRSPAAALAVAEIDALDLTASRRLQLAAEAGGGIGLLLRAPSPAASRAEAALPPTASLSRWRVASAPGGPAAASPWFETPPCFDRPGLRQRGNLVPSLLSKDEVPARMGGDADFRPDSGERASPGMRGPATLPGAPRWRVELLRARGGRPRTWLVEWRDDDDSEDERRAGRAAGGFALVPPLRDRPDRAARSAAGGPVSGGGPDGAYEAGAHEAGAGPLRRTG